MFTPIYLPLFCNTMTSNSNPIYSSHLMKINYMIDKLLCTPKQQSSVLYRNLMIDSIPNLVNKTNDTDIFSTEPRKCTLGDI